MNPDLKALNKELDEILDKYFTSHKVKQSCIEEIAEAVEKSVTPPPMKDPKEFAEEFKQKLESGYFKRDPYPNANPVEDELEHEHYSNIPQDLIDLVRSL